MFSHGKLKKHLGSISSCRAVLKRDLILSYKWKTSLGQARQPVFWTSPMEKRLNWQFYLYFIHSCLFTQLKFLCLLGTRPVRCWRYNDVKNRHSSYPLETFIPSWRPGANHSWYTYLFGVVIKPTKHEYKLL